MESAPSYLWNPYLWKLDHTPPVGNGQSLNHIQQCFIDFPRTVYVINNCSVRSLRYVVVHTCMLHNIAN